MQLEAIADVLGAYEGKRWPLGRLQAGRVRQFPFRVA